MTVTTGWIHQLSCRLLRGSGARPISLVWAVWRAIIANLLFEIRYHAARWPDGPGVTPLLDYSTQARDRKGERRPTRARPARLTRRGRARCTRSRPAGCAARRRRPPWSGPAESR